jgi:hypothetical protein
LAHQFKQLAQTKIIQAVDYCKSFAESHSQQSKTLTQVANNNYSGDGDGAAVQKDFVSSDVANKTSYIRDRPWLVAVFGGLSVLACCIFS